MSTYLPQEVVVEILSRLPPKSLLRFRCVSKTWLDLIGKPDFLSKNILNRAILTDAYNIPNSNGPPPLIVAQAERMDFAGMPIWSFLSYDTLRRASKIRLNLSPLLEHPESDYDMFKIIGSCNGLLCLYLYNFRRGDVYLWDPTGSSGLKALPPVSRSCQSGSDFVIHDVAFGFGQTSKDFRIVRLIELVPASDMFTRRREAEVYSLSDGSCRLLDLRVPWCMFGSSQSAALDGMFLWFDEEELWLGPWDDDEDEDEDEDEDGRRTIIAFDFIEEEFRKIFLPDDSAFVDSDVYGLTLTVLNGSIALMGFPRKTKLSLDVWVMLEFGIQQSWTKLISIRASFDWRRPLGFWKNGELFMESRSGGLVLYDPFTQIMKNLRFKGGVKRTLEVILCMQRPVA